jgi:outer membrane protein
MFKRLMVVVCLVVLAGFTAQSGIANAAEGKIGVMNIQKVLLDSIAGQKAKAIFEKRMNEMKTKFEGDQKALVELQQEIDKKSSAWSKDVQAEKVRELQTKQRELQVKSEDAKLELKQLQDKELEPILKMLQTVVDAYGEKEGYSVILDSKVAVLYASPETDVSDAVKEELDKRLK